MKRGELVLLACVAITAIANACCCCDYCGPSERLPFYTVARATPKAEWDFGGSVTPFGAKVGNGVDLGFLTAPRLYVQTGIGDHCDLGVESDLGPGLGILGKYQFGTGSTDISAGGRASLYGYALPRDRLPTDTINRAGFGRFEVSPRLFIGSQSGGTPWSLDAGASYLGSYGRMGQSSSVSVGAGFGMSLKPFGSMPVYLSPHVELEERLWTTNTLTQVLVPPFSAYAGISLSTSHMF